MSARSDRAVLSKGTVVAVDDDVWTIVEFDLPSERVVAMSGSRTMELTVAEAADALIRAEMLTSSPRPVHDDDVAVVGLSMKAAARYRFQVSVVRFVTGTATIRDVDGLLFTGDHGDFDLAHWKAGSMDARIGHVRTCLSKRKKLGTLGPGQFVCGVSTIKGWCRQVRMSGELALLPARRSGEIEDRVHETFRASVDRQVAALATGSTVTQKTIRLLALDACQQAGIEAADVGSDRATRLYVKDRMTAAVGSAKTAKQRQSRALKPDPGYPGSTALSAMQQVELDQHTVDVVTSDGEKVCRYTIIAAVDSYTGYALAVRCEKPSANSAIVGRAIFDLLANRRLLDSVERAHIYSGLPDHIEVSEEVMYGLVNAVTVDRGPEFVNHHVRETCSRAGVQIVVCAPRAPIQKPVVEAMFGAVRSAAQLLPGYVGSSPDHRGTTVTADGVPVPPSVFESFIRAALSLHNDTPNRPVPGGLKSTPRERFLASLAHRGHLSVLTQPQSLYPFLQRIDRPLTSKGLQLKNRTYRCAQLYEWWSGLDDRKVPARVDDRDVSRIYVPHPDPRDGRWLEVPDAHAPSRGGYSAEFLATVKKKVGARTTNELTRAIDNVLVGAVKHPFTQLQQTIENDRVRQAALDQARSARTAEPPQPDAPDRPAELPRSSTGELPLADAF